MEYIRNHKNVMWNMENKIIMLSKLGKYRLAYSYVMAALVITFTQEDLLYPGIIMMIIGAAIRIWAAGYIMKQDVLALEGPYSYTRNPLYLGSFIAALGALILTMNWWLTPIFITGFAIFYGGKIRSEEDFLRDKFGDEFDEYVRNVPVFIPRFTPYRKSQEYSFSWRMVLHNNEHHSILYTIGLLLVIMLVAYLKR